MGILQDFKGNPVDGGGTDGALAPNDTYATWQTSVNNKVLLKIYATTAGVVRYRSEADENAPIHQITMSAESVFYARITQILAAGTGATGLHGFE